MKVRLLMTALVATTLLAACGNENETGDKNVSPDNDGTEEIRLCSGVTVQQTRAATGTVPDTQIASGQKVQVIVGKLAGDNTDYAGYDQAFTAGGDGTLTGNVMKYPDSKQGVNIYAYHPAGISTAAFAVQADQSTDAAYFNSDLLYSAKKEYAYKAEAHSLTFVHKLSKLTCKLIPGNGTPDLAGVSMQWLNTCSSIGFTKETGVLAGNPADAKPITPHAAYGTIIVPQTVTKANRLMQVTLADGQVLYYTPTEDQVFEGGKKYHYEITVSLSSLTVRSTVTDWEAVADRTGEAVLP